LEYYKLGFEVKNQWSGPGHQTVCTHDEKIERLNRQLYWDPKEDYVLTKPADIGTEVPCLPGARCRSDQTHCVATLDPEVRRIELRELYTIWSLRDVVDGFPGLEEVALILSDIFFHGTPIPMTDTEKNIAYQEHCTTWTTSIQGNCRSAYKPISVFEDSLWVYK
jgi:hypothetical protein